jgi:hypothetical protein
MMKFLKRGGIGASQVPSPELKRAQIESFNADNAPKDSGCHKKISDYPPNIRDEIRRVYLQNGPYQLRGCEFPQVDKEVCCESLIYVGMTNILVGWSIVCK